MNTDTTFTLTHGKGTTSEKGFTINLGCDLVSTMTEDEIVKAAEDAKVISIQGPLRKLDSADAIQDQLRKKYPDATVTEGIERTQSVNSELKALEKILGKDKVAELLRAELEKRTLA